MLYQSALKTIVFTCSLAALAEQAPQISGWMKEANSAASTLRKLESKTGESAVDAAETLGGVYENMIGFWRSRNAADAVKWSEEGKAAALQLANAAHADNAAGAAAAFKTVMSTCQSCHEARREKLPDGGYRIKQPAAR